MAAMTTIQLRRGTQAQWAAANPVLAAGEIGWESDTAEFKVGNGTTPWNTLPYWVSDIVNHGHTSNDITDATSFGKAVLTASSAAVARAAIGAGTSSLALGSTSTTAMPGNKTFDFSEIQGSLGTSQLPPLAVNEIFVVASQTAMLALTAERGDMAVRSDTNQTFVLSADAPSVLANWLVINAPNQVTSVAGRQGAVVLTKNDVGLSSVDNTSDANKPVSSAQLAALNLKANAANPAFTGTPTGITKAHVGLGSVDNTSDLAKPISTATQTALNGKASATHTHTGLDISAIDGGTP